MQISNRSVSMNTVAIDVPSGKSTAAALRSLGEVVQLPLDVVRNVGGLASLAEHLKALNSETRVVLEHAS